MNKNNKIYIGIGLAVVGLYLLHTQRRKLNANGLVSSIFETTPPRYTLELPTRQAPPSGQRVLVRKCRKSPSNYVTKTFNNKTFYQCCRFNVWGLEKGELGCGGGGGVGGVDQSFLDTLREYRNRQRQRAKEEVWVRQHTYSPSLSQGATRQTTLRSN